MTTNDYVGAQSLENLRVGLHLIEGRVMISSPLFCQISGPSGNRTKNFDEPAISAPVQS
jgi:hypothetical protein